MSTAVLLGLLLIKHLILAHVVDFGYSASRNPLARYSNVWLVFHCLMEGLVTLYLLRLPHCGTLTLFLSVECMALVVSALIERRAPMQRLLKTHILTEVAVAGVYTALAVCWSRLM